ncbi:NAD-binding protein [Natronomonas sp. EA1]|uniref:NAD-binding protein n=1 Tax=Natronomonas sp. EA1 TaxID=3421655 RepID=UPI003EBF6FD3
MSGSSPSRWRFFRVRAALLLPTVVAVLSVATGLVNISDVAVDGPFARHIPAALQRTAGFTGAVTGFLMLASVYGLRRRLRIAWYSTVVLLPVTALQGVLQGSAFSFPLVVLSLLSLPTVLANRDVFPEELKLSTTQLAAIAAIVGAQLYGTIGTYALRDHFGGVTTLVDAFWYTIVTGSTVGYGDISPTTATGKVFATSVLLLSVASFAVALGTVLAPAIEARLAQALGTMSQSQLDLMDDHVIVTGVGDLTAPIIDELADGNETFLVITRTPEKAQVLRDRGIEVLVADPSDEEPLRRAGIERARALLAATNDDAQDAMAILTARELNGDLRIVAAATERENVKKLKRAGADTVLSPAVIGGHLLVQSALGQHGVENVADRILGAETPEELD